MSNNKSNSGIEDKPKAGAKDVAHTAVKMGLSTVPILGGAAAELFSAIIVPPISKRRDEWMESIAIALKVLQERVDDFDVENLSQNEIFITTVMHASQVAIRNHQKEKLEALRNAVLNSALANEPEEDMQLMFLNFVDILTPSHLRILKLYSDSEAGEEIYNSMEPSGFVERFFPEINKPEMDQRIGLYCQLFRDLTNYGLMNTSSGLVMPLETERGGLIPTVRGGSITSIGKRFIDFITSPIESDGEERQLL